MKLPLWPIALRKSAAWLILAILAVVAVYRVKLAPVPVLLSEAKPGLVIGEVMGTGTLEARVTTTVSPRIQERLVEVFVDQGDAVAAGQLLALLDDGELKRQLEVAAASLASARATAERVRVDEGRAQAVEQQARQNHQRVAELVSQQVSSQAERDKAIEQLRVAESDLRRARSATLEAEQQINLAEANLAYQRERLTFTRVISPYDGLVTRRDRDPGGVVVPGSSLLQIVATNEFWVSAWVDETAASALTRGQSARVVFRSDPERTYPGEVARQLADRTVDVRHRQIAATRNAGARVAEGDLLIFVDADTAVTGDLLQAVAQAVRQGAIGGGCFARFDDPVPLWGALAVVLANAYTRLFRVAYGWDDQFGCAWSWASIWTAPASTPSSRTPGKIKEPCRRI